MRTTAYGFILPFFITSGIAATLDLPLSACEGNKTHTGYCDIISSIDRTTATANPPKIKDCLESCHGTLADAGDWIVSFIGQPAGYIDHLSTGPCSFSIGRGNGEPLDYSFFMDNQDIVDIHDEVIKKFGGLHSGRVAAEGTMVCQGHQATWTIN